MRRGFFWSIAIVVALISNAEAQNERDRAVQGDRQSLANNPVWLYDDLEEAVSRAAESERPMMIVFR